ncbi:GNAT family N-acetyltransferase [Kitasatospora sp. NPDC059571]|uniref:GNAT family N-acetyltransferase n=1 Tax=Kitasatospora sp. NPDC059571 TaxID=3346871 RepID=UPI0036A2A40F
MTELRPAPAPHLRLAPTARLDLPPLRPEHAEAMAQALADPALHAFTGGEPLDADRLRARYERLAAGPPDPTERWWNWALWLRAEDRPVGFVQATVDGGGRTAEIAWVVGVPWQGRGLAVEAARALAAGLAGAGVARLVAHVHPDHRASAAVAAAVGLRPTGLLQDGEVRWEGPAGRSPDAPVSPR